MLDLKGGKGWFRRGIFRQPGDADQAAPVATGITGWVTG